MKFIVRSSSNMLDICCNKLLMQIKLIIISCNIALVIKYYFVSKQAAVRVRS